MRFVAFLFLIFFSLCGHQAFAESAGYIPPGLETEPTRTRKTDHTYIFTRSQLKYGLEKKHYYNFWLDRPLFVDPALEDATPNPLGLSYQSFLKSWEIMGKYGLDGMAFFPETSGRKIAYDYVQQADSEGKEGGLKLLTELISNTKDAKRDLQTNIQEKAAIIRQAAAHPASFRIDNKLVLTSYGVQSLPIETWKKILDGIRKEENDPFLFLPTLNRFGDYTIENWRKQFQAETIQKEDVEKAKESIREWLRISDGFYFSSTPSARSEERRFYDAFYRNFVVRLIKSVLSEPEFHDKYFGLSAAIGHENARLGYTYSSDATKTLRSSMEASLWAEPEIINIPEWDEQNENTSLRPTIYNGTSSMRILRYYAAKQRHQELSPLPGDRVEIPNLVVSYRKALTLGEKLEVEILHIPDGTAKVPFTVRLILTNLHGKTVYTSEPATLDQNKLEDYTVVVPSESFKEDAVLLPRLEVTADDKKWQFADGLHYIHLHATQTWDYKWVKQPLRDLLEVTQSPFTVTPSSDPSESIVTAQFETNEPLAYVEVLDNDNVVYSHATKNVWRENENEILLSFYWQAPQGAAKPLSIQGSLSLEGSKGRWLLPTGKNAPVLQENTLTRIQANYTPKRTLVAIPRKESEHAEIVVNLPGIFEGKIPVSQILKETMIGFTGPHQFSLVLSRYAGPYDMPPRLKSESASFTIPVLPESPRSVLHLQAVGASGRLYRSKPVQIGKDADKTETITVYSDTAREPVELEVDSSRVPKIHYAFDPKRGSVFYTDSGQWARGMLGGNTSLTTERGGGQSGDGTPFYSSNKYPKDATESAPRWIEEEGVTLLQFDGKGTFITLPQGVIPRRSAFHLTMDIRPERAAAREVLFSNSSNYPGTVTVFRENGMLKVDFLAQNGDSLDGVPAGLKLPAGEWSKLEVFYDQNTLVLAVNGEKGRPLPIKGPGIYDMVTIVGGNQNAWFKGEIKSLEIDHVNVLSHPTNP